jgi:hypothetical protein
MIDGEVPSEHRELIHKLEAEWKHPGAGPAFL